MDRAQININISPDLKKRVQIACVREQMTMTEIIISYLLNFVKESERQEQERLQQEQDPAGG